MNRLCAVYFVMCLFHNVTALLNKRYCNIPVIQTENENYFCITVCGDMFQLQWRNSHPLRNKIFSSLF